MSEKDQENLAEKVAFLEELVEDLKSFESDLKKLASEEEEEAGRGSDKQEMKNLLNKLDYDN